MHWIQTIRQDLGLTQNELAGYLELSVHTVQSIEQGRRELPFKSMRIAIALYNAMNEGRTRSLHDPSPEADHQAQRKLKGLQRRCRHKLVLCREKLQKMQDDYENARRSLNAYELLADTLAPDDLARQKWTEWRIAETLQRIKENNATEQGLLRAEIAALESRTQALENMLAADTFDQGNESAAGCQQDTHDEAQKPSPRQKEIVLNDSAKTLQARYFHLGESLKSVELGLIKPETIDGCHIPGEIKRGNRAGPDPDSGVPASRRPFPKEHSMSHET